MLEPLDLMARLVALVPPPRMWRACRLVVDTGIHAKGWTKQQAVDFMKDNTALTDANIDAEVNRYISWPGQGLACKLGELKILELRRRAESALGAKFDVRLFHDAVLVQGAVPLDVLEASTSPNNQEAQRGAGSRVPIPGPGLSSGGSAAKLRRICGYAERSGRIQT